jgi:hypothetical protein
MSLLQKAENSVPVIPAEAGIQKISGLTQKLDPRFHEDDDFCKSLAFIAIKDADTERQV